MRVQLSHVDSPLTFVDGCACGHFFYFHGFGLAPRPRGGLKETPTHEHGRACAEVSGSATTLILVQPVNWHDFDFGAGDVAITA